MVRVQVSPQVLRWAMTRSGRDEQALATRFPKLLDWVSGEVRPTWRQVQDFANATYVPVGYLFLEEPPEEPLPIPDLRTIADRGVSGPSPNLLESIYLCQQRQGWFQEHAQIHNLDPVDFVGSAATAGDETVVSVAKRMRERLRFTIEQRYAASTFEQALRELVSWVDAAGVMVMTSGIVANNTHRGLNPNEFRGFALVDSYAPLIFINGKSSKSAQMFTLAHELAHVWLGTTALSDAEPGVIATYETERWCNQVAAEFLVPMEAFQEVLQPEEGVKDATQRHASRFKVSTLVIIRRLHEAGVLSRREFWREYEEELERLADLQRPGTGGDFYRAQRNRVSERFMRAVITDTFEGHTLYRDAMNLLGTKKVTTFHELGRRLGMDA